MCVCVWSDRGGAARVLPCTCRVPDASALPTLFSDTQVYVPSSSARTWVRRRLLSLRISNLQRQTRHSTKGDMSTESLVVVECVIEKCDVIWPTKPLTAQLTYGLVNLRLLPTYKQMSIGYSTVLKV